MQAQPNGVSFQDKSLRVCRKSGILVSEEDDWE